MEDPYISKVAHAFRFFGALVMLIAIVHGFVTSFGTELSANFFRTGAGSMLFGILIEAYYHVREEELWI